MVSIKKHCKNYKMTREIQHQEPLQHPPPTAAVQEQGMKRNPTYPCTGDNFGKLPFPLLSNTSFSSNANPKHWTLEKELQIRAVHKIFKSSSFITGGIINGKRVRLIGIPESRDVFHIPGADWHPGILGLGVRSKVKPHFHQALWMLTISICGTNLTMTEVFDNPTTGQVILSKAHALQLLGRHVTTTPAHQDLQKRRL